MSEKTRAYLYRVGTAVIPLLVALSLLTEDIAQLVLGIVAAVLAVGEGALAARHTSTRDA